MVLSKKIIDKFKKSYRNNKNNDLIRNIVSQNNIKNYFKS